MQGFCPGLCLNLYQQRWHKVHTEKSTPVLRVTGLLRNGPLVAGYEQGRVKHPVLYYQYTCSRWDLAVKWRLSPSHFRGCEANIIFEVTSLLISVKPVHGSVLSTSVVFSFSVLCALLIHCRIAINIHVM